MTTNNNGWTWNAAALYPLLDGRLRGNIGKGDIEVRVFAPTDDEVNALRARIAEMDAVREERDRLKAEHAEMREVLHKLKAAEEFAWENGVTIDDHMRHSERYTLITGALTRTTDTKGDDE